MRAIDVAMASVAAATEATFATYARDGKARQCWEILLSIVEDESAIMWHQQAPPNHVGTHPSNRGGLGVQVERAFENGACHIKDGYSIGKANEGAFAVSAPPPPDNVEELRFNDRLCATQSALPPLAALQLTSIGAGHGNAFLRCVLAGSACPIPDIAPSGFLDKASLSKDNEPLKHALKGLTWRVFHWEFVRRWPKVVELGQAVLNRSHNLVISEIEGMMTMHRVAAPYGHMIDWMAVEAEAIASNPPWKPWSASLVKVCKVLDASTMREVALKMGATTNACHGGGLLGPTFLDSLAQQKWKTVKQYPRIRAAVLIANLHSPPLQIETGKCKLFQKKDVSKLTATASHPIVAEAEKLLDEAVDWITHHKITDNIKWKVLGNLDCRCACHLAGVGEMSQDKKTWPSLMSIMQERLPNNITPGKHGWMNVDG
jgi:hypothetical protein